MELSQDAVLSNGVNRGSRQERTKVTLHDTLKGRYESHKAALALGVSLTEASRCCYAEFSLKSHRLWVAPSASWTWLLSF